MPQLDNYLVTLGVKGQNVVLSQMDKIRKGKKDISKKVNVDLGVKAGKTAARSTAADYTTGGKGAPKSSGEKLADQQKKENEKVKKTHKEESDQEKKNNSTFKDAAGKFGQGVQGFASAASSIDPVTTLSGVTSAIGTSLSGLSILGVSLGRLPEGIASITNSTLAMAKSALDMAKQSVSGYYALATRNAAAAHYGGGVKQAQMSNQEHAMFIEAVSSSMGRLQPELVKELDKLVGTKDTRALARVAGGDWESTGEDRGWMLGQLMSGVQGLPPSIKQKFQASLLSRNADLIQNITGTQEGAQSAAAQFAGLEEKQTQALYEKAAPGGKIDQRLITAQADFNSMQEALYGAGLTFTKGIVEATEGLNALGTEVLKVKDALKTIPTLVAHPSMSNVAKLGQAVINAMPQSMRPSK